MTLRGTGPMGRTPNSPATRLLHVDLLSMAWRLRKRTCMGTQTLDSASGTMHVGAPSPGREGDHLPALPATCPRSQALTAAPEPRCAESP